MKERPWQAVFIGGLLLLLVINLFQAGLTGLDPDEAYYWLYAQDLDWGYFDHPPGIAILIRFGSTLVSGTLGVRLGTVLLQLACFWGMWRLAGSPRSNADAILLLLLLAAMPMLQIYGFVATPDGPLLLFSVFFFLAYRQFLRRDTWPNTFLFGLVMALLLYSKYHGVLIIFFTLLSNLRLLRSSRFYLASIFGFLLFFPHLWWQYQHDFPSFRYHFSGRNDTYELKYTLTYLINQFLVFSPLLFPFIVSVLRKKPATDRLDRAYLFNIAGFWAFFFYASFKGHVEPQWTAILSIPFVVFLFRASRERAKTGRLIRRAALISVFLLLLARIVLILPISNLNTPFNTQAWIPVIQNEAGSLPVLFENSYRDPAMYQFYTGQRAYNITNMRYRKSQFDIWDWEKELQNRRVLLVSQGEWTCTGCDTLRPPGRTYIVKTIDSLQLAQKVSVSCTLTDPVWRSGEELVLPIQLHNPYMHDIRLSAGDLPISPWIIFELPEEQLDTIPARWIPSIHTLPARETLDQQLQFQVPDYPQGIYTFAIGLRLGPMPPAYNSRKQKVKFVK